MLWSAPDNSCSVGIQLVLQLSNQPAAWIVIPCRIAEDQSPILSLLEVHKTSLVCIAGNSISSPEGFISTSAVYPCYLAHSPLSLHFKQCRT